MQKSLAGLACSVVLAITFPAAASAALTEAQAIERGRVIIAELASKMDQLAAALSNAAAPTNAVQVFERYTGEFRTLMIRAKALEREYPTFNELAKTAVFSNEMELMKAVTARFSASLAAVLARFSNDQAVMTAMTRFSSALSGAQTDTDTQRTEAGLTDAERKEAESILEEYVRLAERSAADLGKASFAAEAARALTAYRDAMRALQEKSARLQALLSKDGNAFAGPLKTAFERYQASMTTWNGAILKTRERWGADPAVDDLLRNLH